MSSVTETQKDETAAGFLIDGELCEIPSLYSFTMDENQIMFDLSGTPTEDWLMLIESARAGSLSDEQAEASMAKLKNPGFLRGWVHVAYARKHPDVPRTDVEVVVGQSSQVLNWSALFLAGRDEDEPDPPEAASTTRDDASSTLPQPEKPMSEEPQQTNGNGSEKSSDQPDEPRAPTGRTGSGTSSPASVPRLSVR